MIIKNIRKNDFLSSFYGLKDTKFSEVIDLINRTLI